MNKEIAITARLAEEDYLILKEINSNVSNAIRILISTYYDSTYEDYTSNLSPELTFELANQLYNYCEETGEITCKVDFNNYKIGDKITILNKSGYKTVSYNRKSIPAHRLAWLMKEGYWPEYQIDHINRIKGDNRWCNLRHITPSCNIRNTGLSKANTSSVKGITMNNKLNKWVAFIGFGNSSVYLGMFSDFTEAVAHRFAAEQCLEWQTCDTASTASMYIKNYVLEVTK